MRKIFLIVLMFVSIGAVSQNQDVFYFTELGLLVDDAEAAMLKIEKQIISDKKFELIEYVKSGEEWVANKNKLAVTKKNEKSYSIKIIYNDKFIRTHKVKVIEKTSSGYLIKEFDGTWCYRESEVSSIFPLVYHGQVKGLPRYGSPVISWFNRNLRYVDIEQPYLDRVGTDYPDNYAEKLPQYPGGEKFFSNEVIENISLPDGVELANLQGDFFIDFTVCADGSISAKQKTIKTENLEIDCAFVEAINNLSFRWRPAKMHGENVDFKYLFPFRFGEEDVDTLINDSLSIEQISERPDSDSTKVFFLVEKMPEYPEGLLGLRKDIANSIRYPVYAQERAIHGKVYVKFMVDVDGLIKRIRVVRGVHSSLDKEAIRVVKKLKRWIPGEQRGKKVRVGYTIPIIFNIQ